MSRLADAIMQPGAMFTNSISAPALDLRHGGQMGYDRDMTEWISNQSHIRKNIICLLVEAPKFFDYMDDPLAWVGTLRSLVELHPLTIDGLVATLEVEFSSNPVGGAGQVQEDITNVTEGVSKPVFKWNEKYGSPISNFMRAWITMGMMDPNSKYANVNTRLQRPGDMLADMSAATMLFIEPDATHSKVIRSWLCTNMMPRTTGEVVGRRDMTQAGELMSLDVPFTALTQYGTGVNVFAQRIMDSMSITGANPQERQAFVDQITEDIKAAQKSYGSGVEELAASAVNV